MKKTFLAILAALILLPAVSFANDHYPRYRNDQYNRYGRYERNYPERRFWENHRRGYWHQHKSSRKHNGRPIYYYHWHPYGS